MQYLSLKSRAHENRCDAHTVDCCSVAGRGERPELFYAEIATVATWKGEYQQLHLTMTMLPCHLALVSESEPVMKPYVILLLYFSPNPTGTEIRVAVKLTTKSPETTPKQPN